MFVTFAIDAAPRPDETPGAVQAMPDGAYHPPPTVDFASEIRATAI
jgi:hypothetical protein